MDDLEKLLERTTIEFPTPIRMGEIEGTFFDYLKKTVPCDISYTLTIAGTKRQMREERSVPNERYPTKLMGSITRFAKSSLTSSAFEVDINGDLFDKFKFITIPGYGLEELPEGQLELINDTRKRIKEYFSKKLTYR